MWVENDGPGPAIILEETVFIDGKPTIITNLNNCEKILSELGITNSSIHVFFPGASISPNVTVDLLTISTNSPASYVHKFRNALLRVKFKILYESVYGVENGDQQFTNIIEIPR
jgi:hypothetical protein